MAKKDRAPAFWITSDDKLEDVHAPKEAELKDLVRDLLEARAAHPDAMTLQLWDKLGKFIQWQMLPFEWTQERKDRVRWFHVCKGIARVGWDGAFEYASDALRGHPAEAGPDMMKTSYQKIQKALPPEQRRQRTYRRNPRLR